MFWFYYPEGSDNCNGVNIKKNCMPFIIMFAISILKICCVWPSIKNSVAITPFYPKDVIAKG